VLLCQAQRLDSAGIVAQVGDWVLRSSAQLIETRVGSVPAVRGVKPAAIDSSIDLGNFIFDGYR